MNDKVNTKINDYLFDFVYQNKIKPIILGPFGYLIIPFIVFFLFLYYFIRCIIMLLGYFIGLLGIFIVITLPLWTLAISAFYQK